MTSRLPKYDIRANVTALYTPFGWKSGKVGGWKIVEGWKSERMENIVVFPLMCLVGGVEKWEDRKLFCLVGEKKGNDGKCNLCKLTIIPLLHNM